MYNDIISIYVNGYPELNAAVQQMAFKNGWTWSDGSTAVETKEARYLVADVDRRKLFWDMCQVSSTLLDARRQFDEVAKLLSAPKPKPDPMQRYRDAQAAGRYVPYVESITNIRFAFGDVQAIRRGERTASNFECGEGHYVIVGEDIPMPPTDDLLAKWKYELTYEVRAPKLGEYFVNRNNVFIELRDSGVELYGFNGIRWICKKIAPAYKPHTSDTVVLGVTVVQKSDPQYRHLVIGVKKTEVQIGLANYTFAEALDQFVDIYGKPYGVKQ